MKKRTRDANGRFANEKRKPKRHTVEVKLDGHWARWRKTTNDLVDLLDRGLRKIEERFNKLERERQTQGLDWEEWRKAINQITDFVEPLVHRVQVLEDADHGSFVAALSKLEERLGHIEHVWGPAVDSRVDKLAERSDYTHPTVDAHLENRTEELNDQDKVLAARIDGLRADFERFRTVAHERLLNLEVPENAPHEYSLSIPTDTQAIQATVEWRDKRPGVVALHVGDFQHEMGAWCRMSTEQATQLVEALTRAIKGKLTVG